MPKGWKNVARIFERSYRLFYTCGSTKTSGPKTRIHQNVRVRATAILYVLLHHIGTCLYATPVKARNVYRIDCAGELPPRALNVRIRTRRWRSRHERKTVLDWRVARTIFRRQNNNNNRANVRVSESFYDASFVAGPPFHSVRADFRLLKNIPYARVLCSKLKSHSIGGKGYWPYEFSNAKR